MNDLTPLHWFSRIVLGLVLAWGLFMTFRLGITFAGIFTFVVVSFWLWVKSGKGDSW